jgi:hypothetical protein
MIMLVFVLGLSSTKGKKCDIYLSELGKLHLKRIFYSSSHLAVNDKISFFFIAE